MNLFGTYSCQFICGSGKNVHALAFTHPINILNINLTIIPECYHSCTDSFSLKTKPTTVSLINRFNHIVCYQNNNELIIKNLPKEILNLIKAERNDDLSLLLLYNNISLADNKNLRLMFNLIPNNYIINNIKKFLPKINHMRNLGIITEININDQLVKCNSRDSMEYTQDNINEILYNLPKICFLQWCNNIIENFSISHTNETISISSRNIISNPFDLIYYNYCDHFKTILVHFEYLY